MISWNGSPSPVIHELAPQVTYAYLAGSRSDCGAVETGRNVVGLREETETFARSDGGWVLEGRLLAELGTEGESG